MKNTYTPWQWQGKQRIYAFAFGVVGICVENTKATHNAKKHTRKIIMQPDFENKAQIFQTGSGSILYF